MSLNCCESSYTVIIGDMIDSKKIADRSEAQKKFKEVLQNINKKYKNDIAAEFAITLGDEFQGLLKSRRYIVEIISKIEMEMAPVALRFGIGIGDISTDIHFHRSAEIDGPAYHRARKMIKEIESKKYQYADRDSNILICSGEEHFETDELLNSIFSVCTALKSRWTDRQKEVIRVYLSGGENQYKAAELLKIGQPSVNKALSSAKFYSYKKAMDTVSSFLSSDRGDSGD